MLDNACETAAEHAAEYPEEPLDVWRLVERYSCAPMLGLRGATCCPLYLPSAITSKLASL